MTFSLAHFGSAKLTLENYYAPVMYDTTKHYNYTCPTRPRSFPKYIPRVRFSIQLRYLPHPPYSSRPNHYEYATTTIAPIFGVKYWAKSDKPYEFVLQLDNIITTNT